MIDSQALKQEFQESAARHEAKAESLTQQGHTAGSETLKHNAYTEAQKELDIAITLDNCANAIKP